MADEKSSFFRILDDRKLFTSPYTLMYDCEAIEDVLCLMTRRPLPNLSFDRAQINRIKDLVGICKFLRCEDLLEQIFRVINVLWAKAKARQAFDIFVISSVALDNPQLCCRALPMAARSLWSSPVPPGGSPVDHGIPEYSKLDISAMPRNLLEELPMKYIVALGRAFHSRGPNTKRSEGNWNAVATEFYKILTR